MWNQGAPHPELGFNIWYRKRTSGSDLKAAEESQSDKMDDCIDSADRKRNQTQRSVNQIDLNDLLLITTQLELQR